MKDLNITKDKWIKDINSDDLINLKDCIAIEKEIYENEWECYIRFNFNKNSKRLYFKNEMMANNFYEHLKTMLNIEEINSNKPPLKI